MLKKDKFLQMDKKYKDRWFYMSLVLIALFLFLFVGSREPVLFEDSGSYIRLRRSEGVMPIYPLFLLLNQYLFGLDRYLHFVVVEQAVLATLCVVLFTKVVRDKFDLQYRESYLVLFLSLLPFTMELPQSMATQHILTEGVGYSLFYPFMVILLKAVWEKKYTWFAGSLGMVVILAMVRSQLQILFGICGIVFFYIVMCRRKQYEKKAYLLARVAVGIVGCLCVCLVGILVISKIIVWYMDAIKTNDNFSLFILKVQLPEVYEEYVLKQVDEEMGYVERETEDDVGEGSQELSVEDLEHLANTRIPISQYESLIFSRGMYEADREDVELFEDEVVRGLYVALYEAVDAEGERYVYARNGLWMWQDIVGGVGQVGKTCLWIPSAYYAANYPEIITSDHFTETCNEHMMLVGITLLKKHFGRFLYHTLMMLPQAFICTVFFQIKPIYLLCHLVTLFLYLMALALMVWGYADRKVSNKYAEFMALVLGSNVVMVVIISLVFFGQQRYLVYNFGIFYTACYLLLRELWNVRIRDKILTRMTESKNEK